MPWDKSIEDLHVSAGYPKAFINKLMGERGAIPPFLCGIKYQLDDEKGWTSLLKAGANKGWPDSNSKPDLLDWMKKFLSKRDVRKRFFQEFQAETAIKNMMKKGGVEKGNNMLLRVFIGADNGNGWQGPASELFGTYNGAEGIEMRYGSWSAMLEVRDYIKDKWSKKSTNYQTLWDKVDNKGRGGFSWSATTLCKFFGVYGQYHKASLKTEEKLYAAVESIAVITKYVQQGLWDWDDKTETWGVGVDNVMFVSHPNLDQNLVGKIKTNAAAADGMGGLRTQETVKRLAQLQTKTKELKKGAATNVLDDIWKKVGLKQVQAFKIYNVRKGGQKATIQILNPTVVKEKTFRAMTDSMIKEVFGATKKWDAVKIKVDDERRLNTALCLLMLGIGSRSRGILGINKIEAMDTITKSEEDGIGVREAGDAIFAGIGADMTLRVSRITKEKEREVLTKKLMDTSSMGDEEGGMTEKAAREIIKMQSEARIIDKPFQYYFFDPVAFNRRNTGGGDVKVGDLYSTTDTKRQTPRHVFLALLQQVRAALKAGAQSGEKAMKWEKYTTEGLGIDIVSDTQDSGGVVAMARYFSRVYNSMHTRCRELLSQIPTLKNGMGGTHELRRMYVCYSYEYFGRGKVKEIGYAQYVLRHQAIQTSIRYTTLQFEMMMGSEISEKMLKSEEYVQTQLELEKKMDGLDEAIAGLKRRIDDLVGQQQAKRQKGMAKFTLSDGTEVEIPKKSRDKRGGDENDRIKGAMAAVTALRKAKVAITQRNLQSMGVSNDMLKKVYKQMPKGE